MQKQQKLAEERQRRMQTADEFDVEAQKMIEDEIRKKNVKDSNTDRVKFRNGYGA